MPVISKLYFRFLLTGALTAACLMPFVGASFAVTATSTFTVSVQIVASCTVNSAGSINFGNSQGVLIANVDQTSQIWVQCTNSTPFNIGLDAGTGAGATVAVRKMTTGGATVNYSLYTENTHTTVWGNTVSTDTVSDIGSGISVLYTVYGRIPPQSTPAPGTYSDTINVTVTY